jgi:hypothetical protein
MDSRGRPFSQAGRAIDISRRGTRLEGVHCLTQPGEIVGVGHGSKKARYRVAWVKQDGKAEQHQAGLISLEPQKFIWKTSPPESVCDASIYEGKNTSASASAGPTPRIGVGAGREGRRRSWPRCEPRRYPRNRCSGSVALCEEGSNVRTWGKLTDISLTGCYVELLAPPSPETRLDLLVEAGEVRVWAKGRVTTSHPGFGMGIEFVELTEDAKGRLDTLIAAVANQTQKEALQERAYGKAEPPSLPVVVDANVVVGSILEFFATQEVLTRDELVHILRRVRADSFLDEHETGRRQTPVANA